MRKPANNLKSVVLKMLKFTKVCARVRFSVRVIYTVVYTYTVIMSIEMT